MKSVKIKIIGSWSGIDLAISILKERYCVELCEDPDYLIVSPLCDPYVYMNYDCVRILFTGEPLVPDFNVFDYAIGFDYLTITDIKGKNRYYRFPLCFRDIERIKKCGTGMTYNQAKETLQKKAYFCNFIYGHQSAKGEREAIFRALERYKRVESAGSFLNNMPDGKVVPFDEEKIDFLRLCKFTISCESISFPGFVTEKLVDPFFANSVPIYYGNQLVESEFNQEAIINVHSFSTLEECIERIIQIDQNEELYIKMLMAPKLISEDYLENMYNGLKAFLFSIFDQEKNEAYRRMRYYAQKKHEDCLKEYTQLYNSAEYHLFKNRKRIMRFLSRTVN